MPPRKRKGEPVGWQGLYNSRPVLGQCRDCGAPILTAHIEGLHERLDAQPVSPLGELAALLQGSRTFLWTSMHPRLWRRTPYTIRTQSLPLTGVVVRLHQCHNQAALEGPFAATFEPKDTRDDSQPDF